MPEILPSVLLKIWNILVPFLIVSFGSRFLSNSDKFQLFFSVLLLHRFFIFLCFFFSAEFKIIADLFNEIQQMEKTVAIKRDARRGEYGDKWSINKLRKYSLTKHHGDICGWSQFRKIVVFWTCLQFPFALCVLFDSIWLVSLRFDLVLTKAFRTFIIVFKSRLIKCTTRQEIFISELSKQ